MIQSDAVTQLLVGSGIDAFSLLAGLTLIGAASFGALYISMRKKHK